MQDKSTTAVEVKGSRHSKLRRAVTTLLGGVATSVVVIVFTVLPFLLWGVGFAIAIVIAVIFLRFIFG